MNPAITPLDPWVRAKIGSAELSREAIEAYQLDRLNQTLSLVARKSRFYHQRLNGLPTRLSSLAELAEVPFTTARDLQESGLQMVCVSQDDIQRIVTLDTSGTTGQPKRLYFTKVDQDLTLDFFRVGMSTFTEPGDKVLILLPCERVGSVGDLLAKALEALGAKPVKYGIVRDIPETLRGMTSEEIDGVVGIPLQVLWLARQGQVAHVKSVLLTTDYVPGAVARAVEQAWGCTVYNHYGMTEMGLGGGVECQARRGYHLREADMIVEIVDPVSGRPTADGEEGEVVFTTLTRMGMPLIRYRTGDISRFIPCGCPCGTSLKTLAKIRRRVDGIIHLGESGGVTLAELDEALLSVEEVLDFEAAVIRGSGRDTLRLKVHVLQSDESQIKPKLEAALESVPAIHRAATGGHFEMQIEIPAVWTVPARPAKRSIRVEDHRAS